MEREKKKINRDQVLKGIIILVVVWAIIAAGVIIFNKTNNTASQTTEVSPDMQNLITRMADGDPVVTGANITDHDFTKAAGDQWARIQEDFADRGSQVVRDSENRHGDFEDFVVEELKAAGYGDGDIEIDKHSETTIMNEDFNGVNIIATLEGRDPSKQIVLIGGYDGTYDQYKKGISSGDDGSSAAILLAEATGMAGLKEKPQYTVKFVFADGEVDDQRGSTWYARTMAKKDVESTVFALRLLTGTDKKAGEDTGSCRLTGGILEGGELKYTEALDYGVETSDRLALTTKTVETTVGKTGSEETEPFSQYGIEYVDMSADMGGNAVKLITAMLMGDK